MENEENVKELEDNKAETDATEQKDTTNTEEKSPNDETEAKEEVNSDSETGTEEKPVDPVVPVVPVVPEQILEEQKQQYTTELIENDNFTLEIAHQITVGDMLVSTLLAANIAVLLLCRLIRDRK